ncbi:MAG: ribosomal RNA small subunit methyltransferase A, partial [Luteolibacter sp.]
PVEIARIAPSAATGWEHIRLYRYEHQGSIRFPAAEIESAMWVPVATLNAWIQNCPEDFASGFLECWKASQR